MSEATSSGISSNNASFVNSEVIAERIDTSRLIGAIKSMLEGQVVVPEPDKATGGIKYVVIKSGEPLMNELGVQMMMITVNLMFSAFFAQGYITREDYDRIIQENDNNISEDLMTNLDVWEVNILNYNHIINSIVHLNQGYSSQAIDGHLTNSITQSVRFVESNTTKERGNLFPFGGRN